MTAFLKFLGFIVILAVAVLLGGYAIATLWGWFIVPTFHLPTLSNTQAYGMSLLVSYLTHQVPPKGAQERTFSENFALAIVKPLIFLGIGWVVLQFV